MPVLRDAAAFDAIQIEGLEVDRLALTLNRAELASEVAVEMQVNADPIAKDDHLVDLRAQIRHCVAKGLRSGERPTRPLRSAGRQRSINEVRGERSLRVARITRVPESGVATSSSHDLRAWRGGGQMMRLWQRIGGAGTSCDGAGRGRSGDDRGDGVSFHRESFF